MLKTPKEPIFTVPLPSVKRNVEIRPNVVLEVRLPENNKTYDVLITQLQQLQAKYRSKLDFQKTRSLQEEQDRKLLQKCIELDQHNIQQCTQQLKLILVQKQNLLDMIKDQSLPEIKELAFSIQHISDIIQ